MRHHAAALTRKLGPLPVWAWALGSGVVLYVVRNRQGGGSGGGILGSLGFASGGTGTSASPAGGTTGEPGPAGPAGPTGPAGKVPKAKKPPRHRKKKKHRPHRRHHRAHGHPRGPHGPTPRPQARPRLVIPGLKPVRDRAGVTASADAMGVTRLLRVRGYHTRAGLDARPPAGTNAVDAQRSSIGLPDGARAHTGGLEAVPASRARTAAPAPEGRTDRSRGMTGQPAPHALDREQPPAPAHHEPARTPDPHAANLHPRRHR